ncbi:uncharacterized protein B0H18DRAFT_1034425 [Fomitopsis serialis]|uniref:uncharacterized protein n=1 Tax=Fomitopsis serialis TaxID=139415 RepID=UPI00200799BF|nr:uncharacterized protein B0H18DRAFT_1034425 [Neoantrodia serialis]KAH9917511.1 hypothetical protein B0H18DRAFT_1034425 [Neoantrodia serialis]
MILTQSILVSYELQLYRGTSSLLLVLSFCPPWTEHLLPVRNHPAGAVLSTGKSIP